MSLEQTFRDPTEEERAWLAEQKSKTERLLAGNPDAQEKYKSAAGKLGTIRAVLQGGRFKPEQTFELQGLGIILGDAIASEMGMVWKMVEDQHGVSPCLILEGTSIAIYPQTMISKRVESGETIDVFALFNGICAQIDELKARGV